MRSRCTTLLRVKRSSLLLSAFAGLFLMALALILFWPRGELPERPLEGLPAAVQGLVRVRVTRVMASTAWREIVVERGEARGIERVTKACGFNPLDGLEEVFVFAVPAAQDKSDVVVSARGAIDHTKLSACVVTYSGGSGASFVHERVAGFDTMRANKGTARAAFVGRHAFVAGDALGVVATLRTLAKQAPNAALDPWFAAQYAALSPDSDIALLVRVPSDPKRRAALLKKLPLPASFPLAELRALGLELHLVEDKVRIDARFTMIDAEAATRLSATFSEIRTRFLALPGLGLMGFTTPLREARIETAVDTLKIHGEIKASLVNAAIDLLPALVALQRPLPTPAKGPVDPSVRPTDAGP